MKNECTELAARHEELVKLAREVIRVMHNSAQAQLDSDEWEMPWEAIDDLEEALRNEGGDDQ